MATPASRGRLAILVGGGPAPGINGVISSVTIEAINQGWEVIGIRDGFKNLVSGDITKIKTLTIADVAPYYNRGGSLLGTSRTNPAKKDEDLLSVISSLDRLGAKYLVTIGGDDTAFSGSQVYKRAAGKIKVAHVPKTIDNDLPLPPGIPTFGFETARHIGVGLARNIHEDAKTTTRWYLIVSMGRAAGHLALGIGKASAATVTIISEEFRGNHVKLSQICDIIIGSIIKRRSQGKEYGLVILAEGLIEAIGENNLVTDLGHFRLEKDSIATANKAVKVTDKWLAENIREAAQERCKLLSKKDGSNEFEVESMIQVLGEDELSRYGTLQRDDHGHLRLGEIELGRIIRNQLDWRLGKLGLKITMVDKDLGYELRCADPIPFDAEYTRNLGYGAVKFLMSPESSEYGAIVSFVGGKMTPLKFEDMIDPKTSRMRPRLVDVDSETFECGRRYMIRLEATDFADPATLASLAEVVKMTPAQFRQHFEYLVK